MAAEGVEILLRDNLRRLKLPAMALKFSRAGRQAREAGSSYEQYLVGSNRCRACKEGREPVEEEA